MAFIDGLSTGLDTTAIIDSLLAVERIPQQRIMARRQRSQEASKQLGSLRTSVTNLRNAAADLRLGSGWQKLSATSSSESVQVEATSGRLTGAITFQVDSVASRHVVYSDTVFASLDTNVGLRGSLTDVIESINSDAELGYSAVAVNTGNGYRLQLSSDESGAAAAMTLDPGLALDVGGFTTLTEGADAQITFDGLTPYSITSSTNSFADIMPGVNVTVSEASATPVTVSVTHDFEQIADSVSELIAQFNEVKSSMSTATKVNPDLAEQVPLAFNTNVRRSEQGLLRAVVDPVDASSYGAPSLIGVELQRDGSVTFDRDKFIEAATEDLEQVTRMFTNGFEDGAEEGVLDRMVAAADAASAYGTGLLSTAEESEKARIEDFTDQIDAFEERLERKELQLRRLYSDLEVAIGGLNSQSNWLAGQLNSLQNINSGN